MNGISQKKFEQTAGLSNGYMDKLRNEPSPTKLQSIISAFPDINREWLLYGTGDMINVPARECEIPLLPIYAIGGSLNDFVAAVQSSDCEKIISPVMGAELAITVTGESMYPEFPSGSIVFIKKINEDAFIEWGKAYVLDTCNGAVIKVLTPSDSQDKIRCVSINKDSLYAPFEIRKSDIFGVYKILLCMSKK